MVAGGTSFLSVMSACCNEEPHLQAREPGIPLGRSGRLAAGPGEPAIAWQVVGYVEKIEVASESVPLLEMLPEVASVLRRYGKGIAGN